MKLIPLAVLLTSLATNAQKFRQEPFPFPPQFQTPNAGLYSSDSSLYLPPESHTPIPYFPMKNHNGLQYPLLPPTGTKAPSIYPTPFPFIMSTTLVPNFEDDDDDDDRGRIRLTSSSSMQHRKNQTDRSQEHNQKENREMRSIPMRVFPQPIQNRNDIKFPFSNPPPSMTTSTTSAPNNPTPATRRMIIETKSDLGLDQLRAASLQGGPFIPAGGGLYVSSTTEPAIPILRLSNEMDLDGSFSYEALGADQTHYVQHSRMENLGPDKQEQVVEGSYSYVGDNGQTYTVHYIADANGFRASGDHLPVAPPVPEIIQRAVQYNLQEEAKKPPHLRDNGIWQDDRRDNEISDNNKPPQFSLPPPNRNLFTGRTPEAFSYSYSQGSNTGNNLVTAASNQAPKTVEFTKTTEQPKPKPNNGPISPQITFLASQGAHVPSMNSVQDAISRMFTNDKSPLPQLMHYEAGVKEADQEADKGLWRWQYGMPANNMNQTPNKETISRSFGEGDDIMINFGDMTAEQYTKMIRSQFEYTPEKESVNRFSHNLENKDHLSPNNYIQKYYQNQQPYQEFQNQNRANSDYAANTYINNYPVHGDNQPSPSTIASFPQSEDQYNNMKENFNQLNQDNQNQIQSTSKPINLSQYSQSNRQDIQVQSTNKPLNVNEYSQTNNFQTSSKPIQNNQYNNNQFMQPTNKHDNLKQDPSTAIKTTVESRKLISDTSKILTHKDFLFPSKTVTQSYDFDEDSFYEPRKIKALNNELVTKTSANSNNVVATSNDNKKQYDFSSFFHDSGYTSDKIWDKGELENKQSTTAEPHISTVRDIKFSDFILQDNTNDFKPIVSTTSTETPKLVETTTENIIEDILQNNIFLKNLFSPENAEAPTTQTPEPILQQISEKEHTEVKQYPEIYQYSQVKRYPEVEQEPQLKMYSQVNGNENSQARHEIKTQTNVPEESEQILHTKVEAEPKTDKITKLVPFQTKQGNELNVVKKKPMDLAEIINFVTLKNHFEPTKVKTKSNKPVNNYDHKHEIKFIPIQQERKQNEVIQESKPSFRPQLHQQDELKGLIKNYKVLHRNNNNMKYENGHLKRELSPPPLKSQLPPLGRAGPSMKSYLPPIFV